MVEIKIGTVTIVLPDGVVIDSRAGNLTKEEKRELPKARKGLGLACSQTAVALEKAGPSFSVSGVTADQLRVQGELAERLDEVVEDVQLALNTLKQANLLADVEAYTSLRKINNQVKSQSEFEPGLKDRFSSVINYFSRSRR